jgi:peptidoglycan hydrolase-like protein with peptidoglycan-binding domain
MMRVRGARLLAASAVALLALTGCGNAGSDEKVGSRLSTPTNAVPPLLADVPQPVSTIAHLLHDELNRLGYPVGRIDDGFTTRVTRALKRFQRAHGIEPTGAIDQRTAVAIRAETGRRQKTIVRGLQSVLTELGLYRGLIDGDYGPATTEAVEELQQAHDLNVTGKVDAATIVAMVDAWRQKELPAPMRPVATGPELLRTGDRGPRVAKLQRRLAELGYRPGEADGTFGAATMSAVVAFEKHEGLDRDGVAGPDVQDRLDAPQGAGPRSDSPQPHVEVDLDRQIAFVVLADGVTILDVSTGSGEVYTTPGTTDRQVAYTPTGTFPVYRRVGELVRAPLGTLYKPLYFKEGWAMHGEPIVPPYPGSHGCVRTHDWDQDWLFPRIPMETPIVIYGSNPPGTPPVGDSQPGY